MDIWPKGLKQGLAEEHTDPDFAKLKDILDLDVLLEHCPSRTGSRSEAT